MTLREWRKSKGWSQTELASQLGCALNTVSRTERGETMPTPLLGLRIVELTKGQVSLDEIYQTTGVVNG